MTKYDFINALEPLFVAIVVITGITVADVEAWFKITSLGVTTLYAIWRFVTDYKDRKNKK